VRRCVVVGVLAVVAATSGCGFLADLANPDDDVPVAAADETAPATSTMRTPEPEKPTVIADGQLTRDGGLLAGRLTVTANPARAGLLPMVPNVVDCPLDAAVLQYVEVEFGYTSPSPGLAAHVEISRGPATPADVADVGIFADSTNPDETYCDDAPPLPTRDKFWNQMGARTVAAFVVLDQAVTPATPEGRAAVFPTLQLRISDLRVFEDEMHQRSLGVGDLTIGAACPDDPAAICVPLG
jgi:hypothetical protein